MEKSEALCQIAGVNRDVNGVTLTITSTLNHLITQKKYSPSVLMNEFTHLLDYFSAKEILYIYTLANNKDIPIIEKPVLPKSLLLYFNLCVLQIVCLISANILSSKIMHIWGTDIVAGALCFPFTYSMSSMIAELYGFKMARLSLFWSIMANTLIILWLQLGKIIPPSELWQYQDAFAIVINSASRLFMASTIAIVIGDLTNCYLIVYLRNNYPKFSITYRLLATNLIGLFIDSFIFILIAHTNTLNAFAMLNMLFNILFHKFAYEVLACLFIGFIINRIKQRYPDLHCEALELSFFKTKM